MSEHAHPLKDTKYWLSHPDKYREIMANRRRDQAHHVFQPKVVEKPPPPPEHKELDNTPPEQDESNMPDDYVQKTEGAWSTPI